jgi:hypothetical protein
MKKKILLTITTVILATFSFALPALADTSADVTITATPYFIGISNDPSTWTLNGITGSSVVLVDTKYYSNPLGDTTAPSATVVNGECRFTLTNDSTIDIDLKVTVGAFSGGDADMTNSDDGSNDATHFGAYAWYSGMTYANKVIAKSAASDDLYSSYSGSSLKWGAEIETRTGAWTGGDASTATMTIAATAA